MKYIPPKKLKIIMGLFFGTGVWGMIYGLETHNAVSFMITIFGAINFCLGGVFGYRLLTQEKPSPEKRKK